MIEDKKTPAATPDTPPVAARPADGPKATEADKPHDTGGAAGEGAGPHDD